MDGADHISMAEFSYNILNIWEQGLALHGGFWNGTTIS